MQKALLLVLKCPLNRHGGPYLGRTEVALTLRLPSILRPLAAAVGTAGSPSVLPRARPAPAAEVWQRGAGEGAAADGDCRKAGC